MLTKFLQRNKSGLAGAFHTVGFRLCPLTNKEKESTAVFPGRWIARELLPEADFIADTAAQDAPATSVDGTPDSQWDFPVPLDSPAAPAQKILIPWGSELNPPKLIADGEFRLAPLRRVLD
jgi:hypothetical protein